MNGYFEIELKKALDMLLEEEIKEIENMDMPDFVFSRRHERRMEKIFNTGTYKSFAVRKAFKILVAALLSVLLGIGVAATVSKEFREVLEDTVIKISDSISAYITHGKVSSAFSVHEGTKTGNSYITKANKSDVEEQDVVYSTESFGKGLLWELKYIPDGYSTVYEWYGDSSGSVGYASSKGNDTIMFHYENIDSTLFVNNEDVEVEQFERDGVVYSALVAEEGSDKENMIVWYDTEFVFSLHSKSDIEILKKIAFSVKKVK